MAPRKRLRRNTDLPPNLYPNRVGGVTYYRYKRPDTGTFHSLGSVKSVAIADARQLNLILDRPKDRAGRVIGVEQRSMAHLIKRYREEYLPGQKIAPSTLQNAGYKMDRFNADLGSRPIDSFDVRSVAEYLDGNFERDSYVKHRAALADLFRFAQMKGLYPSGLDNPASATYAKSDYGKQRRRMTPGQFKAIYNAAPDWMQIAMELGLVTLQGRAEVINMRFSDCNDSGSAIKVVREKVKKHEHAFLLIESPHLAGIVSKSRRSDIASPYIVHREPSRRSAAKDRSHWTQLTANHFSAEFRRIRDSTGEFDDMPREQRPTFHEIRSYGSWLYKKQGFNTEQYIQPLMAHSDEKMTEHYQKGHEQEWVRVKAELDVSGIISRG